MRALITGIHGFIGHHVAVSMLRRGHAVLGVDRIVEAISPKEERIRALDAAGGCRVEDLDLAEYERLLALVKRWKPDVVIHLAAQFPIRHSIDAIHRYVASNVTGWLHVAEACHVAGVPRMLYASSITARHSLASSLYGATKAFGEQAAGEYARMGMTLIGLRYAAVYGPSIRDDAQTARVAKRLLSGTPFPAETRLDQPTMMIEIRDAAEVTVRLAEAMLPQQAHVFLVAADDDMATMQDVAEVLASELGVPGPPPPARRVPRHGRPDLAPLQDAISYVPPTTMPDGMRRFAKWLKSGNLNVTRA